jgi:hypothetical protein
LKQWQRGESSLLNGCCTHGLDENIPTENVHLLWEFLVPRVR